MANKRCSTIVIPSIGIEASGIKRIPHGIKIPNKMMKNNSADVALVSLGFPEKRDKGYFLKAHNVAKGDAFENAFSWEMGGDMPLIQQRGAVIALNTLRLGLLKGNQKTVEN